MSRKPRSTNTAPGLKPVLFLALVLLSVGGGLGWIWLRSQSDRRMLLSPGAGIGLEDQAAAYATYGGSASCRECHVEAFEAWRTSHHGLAERGPAANLEDAAFLPERTFPHGTQQTTVRKQGDQYELITPGLAGSNEVFRVERVIGENPLRQLLVPLPGGRLQATEAAWDPRSNQWFNVYGAEDRKPGEWGHWTGRGMNWNTMCAACHNTRLRKNYDPLADAYRTAWVENGVGCESCHGPMRAHNAWQYANKGKGLKDPTLSKLTRDQMFDTCAGCHSRRAEITGDPKPGDSFWDHHLLSIVDESNLFYPDGQIWDEDYEVTPFLGSRMYHKGVRCVDCHDVHTMKTRLPGNFLCLSCHAEGSTNALAINPVKHSRHKVFGYDTNGVLVNADLTKYKPSQIAETGGECVNCHMPQTVYMQRHSRHDHGFTIPDPLLTKQYGIPNACERCHADKGTDWNLKYVQEWYGDKMNRPYRRRAEVAALARRGDPAARDGLLAMLKQDEQFYWQAVAANLLERWVAEPPVTAALADQLKHTNALVRQMVVQAMGPLARLGRPDALKALQSRLNDASRNVRMEAARQLAASLDTNTLAGVEYLAFLDYISDQPLGQMQIGGFEFMRGEVTNALEHYRKAAEWDPYSAGIRHELAIVYSQAGRSREAVTELEAAVRLAPDDAEYHFKLALALNEAGETARVTSELELAVRHDPRHARAWYNLGLARSGQGDFDGAMQALSRGEAADPVDARIPYARATILARAGRVFEAREAARRALQLEPGNADAAALLDRLNRQ